MKRRQLLHSLAALGIGLLMVNAEVCAQTPEIAQKMEAIPTLDVQKLVNDAIEKGQNRLKLPEGKWRLATSNLRVQKATNLVIDGTGCTLLFGSLTNIGLIVTQSRDVTLRGLTIDFNPLPFTQGTIVDTAPDKSWFEVELHEGYPDFTPDYTVSRANVFHPQTLEWKRGTPDLYPQVKALTPRRARLTLNSKPLGYQTVDKGDYVVFNVRSGGGVIFTASENVRVEDVNVLSAPGLAIAGRFLKGKNYFRYKVQRGPTPVGAKVGRLFSASADAFNYAYARGGPALENCDFSFMGDDSVNIHGVAMPVLKIEGNTLWTARPGGEEPWNYILEAGDKALFLDVKNFAPRTEGVLERWETTDALPLTTDEIKRYWPASKPTRLTFYKVTLKAPLTARLDDWLEFPAIGGHGYTIQNNRFHDHRARGLRIMASNGLVANNVFERIQNAGISVGPELTFWREATWPEDVVIRNNVFRDVSRGAAVFAPDSPTPGAISLMFHPENEANEIYKGTRRIRIEKNHIEYSGPIGIYMRAAQDVTIRGNSLQSSTQPRRTIVSRDADGIVVEGNLCDGEPCGLQTLSKKTNE
jgi:hypothetical protein